MNGYETATAQGKIAENHEEFNWIYETSGYSAFLRGNGEITSALQEIDEIYLTPIVLGELYAGFSLGKHERRNREVLKEFLATPRVKTIDMDEGTAERYAVILAYLRAKGTPIPTIDIWIAASAMQHGLKILTTDAHFRKVPQVIVQCCEI